MENCGASDALALSPDFSIGLASTFSGNGSIETNALTPHGEASNDNTVGGYVEMGDSGYNGELVFCVNAQTANNISVYVYAMSTSAADNAFFAWWDFQGENHRKLVETDTGIVSHWQWHGIYCENVNIPMGSPDKAPESFREGNSNY